jgi:hypothetical protein
MRIQSLDAMYPGYSIRWVAEAGRSRDRTRIASERDQHYKMMASIARKLSL